MQLWHREYYVANEATEITDIGHWSVFNNEIGITIYMWMCRFGNKYCANIYAEDNYIVEIISWENMELFLILAILILRSSNG